MSFRHVHCVGGKGETAEPMGLQAHPTWGAPNPPGPPQLSHETGKRLFSPQWGGGRDTAAFPAGTPGPLRESHPICSGSTAVPRPTQEPRGRVV